MRVMSMLDTTPEASALQLEAYRRMSPGARLRVGLELTEVSRQLLVAGIRRRHPDYDEADVRLAFLRLWLGPDLFRQVYPAGSERDP
jgi:hypothetical protein